MDPHRKNKPAKSSAGEKKSQDPAETLFDPDTKEPLIKVARRAQEFCNKEETRHREALYIMVAAALYVRLGMTDPGNWADLCADSYWQHRATKNRPKAGMSEKQKSKFTGLFLFAGPKEIRYDRAWKYSQVLHYYYALGVLPDGLKAQLKKDGGIDDVVAKVAANNVNPSKARTKDTDGDDSAITSEDDTDKEESDDENDQAPKSTKKNKKPTKTFLLEIEIDRTSVSDAMVRSPGKKILIYAIQEKSTGKYVPYRALKYSSGPSAKMD